MNEPDARRCPRCGEGRLLEAQRGGPNRYTCGHADFSADLPAGRIHFLEPHWDEPLGED